MHVVRALLDEGWKKPRCVQACPPARCAWNTSRMREMERMETEKLELLHPEYGTRPRVYYKNLYRFESVSSPAAWLYEKNES